MMPILAQAKSLLPRLCVFCDGPLGANAALCQYCLEDWLNSPDCLFWIDILSRPQVAKTLNAANLTHIYCLSQHNAQIASLIRNFKYRQNRLAARALAELIDTCPDAPIDHALLVPVPMHWLRRYWRGLNQAQWIADYLAASYKIGSANLIKRIRYTQRQAKLNAAERRKNLAQAFALDKVVLSGAELPEKCILVDDVVTSGSTLNALAFLLKKHGVQEVSAITLSWSPAPLLK